MFTFKNPKHLIILLLIPLIMGFSMKTLPQQTDRITIHIESIGGFLSKSPVWIDIYKIKTSIKIVYAVQMEKDYNLLWGDKDYISAHSFLINGSHENSSFLSMNQAKKDSVLNKLDDLYRKYAGQVDSISFADTKDTSYNNLLFRVVNASKDELENTVANQNRNIMDGIHHKFEIITNSKIKTVQAHSPDTKSHPLLYALLKQTVELYQTEKGKPFPGRVME